MWLHYDRLRLDYTLNRGKILDCDYSETKNQDYDVITYILIVCNRLQLHGDDYYKSGLIIEISTWNKITALEAFNNLSFVSRMKLSKTRINSLIILVTTNFATKYNFFKI